MESLQQQRASAEQKKFLISSGVGGISLRTTVRGGLAAVLAFLDWLVSFLPTTRGRANAGTNLPRTSKTNKRKKGGRDA